MLRRFIATILALVLAGAAPLPAQDAAPEPPKALPPAALPPAGGSIDLGLEGATRAVRLRVERASPSDRHGSLVPAAGASFLVLDTTWTNVIPATLAEERGIPAEYRIPSLGDHLYLVLDGSRLGRIHPAGGGQPEHVPAVDFAVPAGARIRGKVLFEVPPGGATSVELKYYDWATTTSTPSSGWGGSSTPSSSADTSGTRRARGSWSRANGRTGHGSSGRVTRWTRGCARASRSSS